MTPSPALQVLVHHTSGLISEFEQQDEEGAIAFLAHVNPRKVFTSPVLILAGVFSASNISTRHVARIDILTQQSVPCQYPDWISELTLIPTNKEFLAAAGLEDGKAKPTASSVAPGEFFEGYVAYHLLGADPVYARLQATITVPVELRGRLAHLFELPYIQFRRPEGGTTLINPAHLVRLTIFPGPPVLGADVWPAELVTL